MKILVIEDDDDTASYVAKGLIEQGHVVDRAANGRDGLFLAAGETYDVLIVDRMPREHPVNDQHVVCLTRGQKETVAAVRRPVHHVALFNEALGNVARGVIVVLDDEDLHRRPSSSTEPFCGRAPRATVT